MIIIKKIYIYKVQYNIIYIRSNFDKGLHILTTTLIKKQHIIIRTAMLYIYIKDIYIILNAQVVLSMATIRLK